MILVDTNVIIDFWDKPTEKIKKIFEENELAICGVIKTELLRGCNALNSLRYLPFTESDWLLLAKQFITLKQNGLVVPFQDAMIAYLAIKNNCEIWTNDKHFKLMQVVLPKLKLFSCVVN